MCFSRFVLFLILVIARTGPGAGSNPSPFRKRARSLDCRERGQRAFAANRY